MASSLEAQLILCDAAQADSTTGKVHMLGAGWSFTSSPSNPHAVVVLAKIPWDRANQPIPFSLRLVDSDGKPVTVHTPDGEVGIGHDGKFEVGRPAGMVPGAMLDWSYALGVGPLPLGPGRYEWRLEIAEEVRIAPFTAR